MKVEKKRSWCEKETTDSDPGEAVKTPRERCAGGTRSGGPRPS